MGRTDRRRGVGWPSRGGRFVYTSTGMVAEAPIRTWRDWPTALAAKLAAEWPLLCALLAGGLLRTLAVLGFRPALYINDSLEYVGVALRWQAYTVRPDGYSAFLRLLLPFHSIALVVILQHIMGLAIGTMIYALLRHLRVRRWLATLACLLYLLDVHEIQLEHLLLSDTLFLLLLMAGVTLLAWQSKVSPWFAGAAGLLLALSTLTRTVGIPLMVIAGLYLVVRWSGWRPLVAFVALAALPLAAYAGWFDHDHGDFAMSNSDGIYLYARVMAFADCGVIKPPSDVAMLCDSRPPSQRGLPSNFIWHQSPLENLPGPKNGETALAAARFTGLRNSRARQFAIDAIAAQPGAYLRTTWDYFSMTFHWSRPAYPSKLYLQEDSFSRHPTAIPFSRVAVAGATAGHDMTAYNDGDPSTHLVAPFASLLLWYQRFGSVPGPILAGLLVVGFLGCVVRRRDARRGQVLLQWTMAMSLLVLTPLSAQFDNRYVLPALPFALTAAALSLAVLIPDWSTPDHRRVRRKPAFRMVDSPAPEAVV